MVEDGGFDKREGALEGGVFAALVETDGTKPQSERPQFKDLNAAAVRRCRKDSLVGTQTPSMLCFQLQSCDQTLQELLLASSRTS